MMQEEDGIQGRKISKMSTSICEEIKGKNKTLCLSKKQVIVSLIQAISDVCRQAETRAESIDLTEKSMSFMVYCMNMVVSNARDK